MPIVAVNITPKLYGQVARLVEKGLYESIELYLEIAALNQLALERGATPDEIVERGHREPTGASPLAINANRSTAKKSRLRPKPKRQPAARRSEAAVTTEDELHAAMDRFSLDRAAGDLPAAVEASQRPDNERLWGQVNRLLPLKIVARWLATEASGKSTWPRFDPVADALADDAALLGTALEKADISAGRKRDQALAVGLPRKGNHASKTRFLNQVLARVTRAGDVYPGAIVHYALAEFSADEVALTDRGLAFAKLRNPVLDDGVLNASETMTNEERAYLRAHVKELVPREQADFTMIVRAVYRGSINPTGLLGAVRNCFPSEWSDMMLRTHVVGLVARLTELGILGREWQGRHVTYMVTEPSWMQHDPSEASGG